MFREAVMEGLGFSHGGVANRDEVVLVGGDIIGPDETFVVGEDFGDDAEDAGNTDAVATHEDGELLAGGVLEFEAEGVGVFGAEGEDIANFRSGTFDELFPGDLEVGENIVLEDFFVEDDRKVGGVINIVFAEGSESLELMAEFREGAAAGESFVGDVADAEAGVDFLVGLFD